MIRSLLFALLLASIISCGYNYKAEGVNEKPTLDNFPNFNWILGDWIRIDDKSNQSTYEYWEETFANGFHGLGCTIQDTDTIFKENIRLYENQSNWFFEVTGVNESPTTFEIISMTDSSFVCENPENEFPKKISYTFINGRIEAIISDETVEIPFTFKKLR